MWYFYIVEITMQKAKRVNASKNEMQDSIWVSRHAKALDKYSGRWIAVLNGKILATGSSAKQVMEKVKLKDIHELPLVIKQPKKSDGWYVL